PRLDHRAYLDQPQARGLREMANGLCLGLCRHPLRHGLRPRLDLCQSAQQGETTMSSYSVTEPSLRQKWAAGTLVILYALITILPLIWIITTSFKTPSDAIAYPPKTFFTPTVEGYVNVFTTRTRLSPEQLQALGEPTTWYDKLVRKDGLVISGPSRFAERFTNSVIIGFGSTVLCIVLGTVAAYAFSRFKVPLKDDLLFFIL